MLKESRTCILLSVIIDEETWESSAKKISTLEQRQFNLKWWILHIYLQVSGVVLTPSCSPVSQMSISNRYINTQQMVILQFAEVLIWNIHEIEEYLMNKWKYNLVKHSHLCFSYLFCYHLHCYIWSHLITMSLGLMLKQVFSRWRSFYMRPPF